ncbi:MAG: trigger factor [Cellvibrionaceae bacterium]|nr:trigger factor [Cellvibrionaceae bacterium]
MQVSIETTSGLERRLTVGVPANVIDQEVNKRLQEAAKSVRLNGFRKGKVPFKVVRQKFGSGVRQEVLGDTINRSFQEAVRQKDLKPAGQPRIEPKQFDEGKDLEYVATFEVFPEISLREIDGIQITQLEADISEQDIDEMIETLRKSQAGWAIAERAAQDGDRVNIDFVGTKDGEEFEGGSAKGYTLQLGSGSMIPGFEAGIVGMAAGETKALPLTFPEDYQVDALKDAAVEFSVTLNNVSEQQLPELNDSFFASFGISEGGLEKFRTDVRENMEREKERMVKTKVKVQVLDSLLDANQVETPKSLVQNEIDVLRQQAIQQYGQLSSRLDVRSLLPDDLFRKRAERRTALGLLISEIVSQQKIMVDNERVRKLVESIASTYEDPESVINYYYSNNDLLSGARAAVLEDQVVDHLLSKAALSTKKVSYQELVKPEKDEIEG